MRVVVAMSGGVDSSVAAGRLVEQGHDVIGVHLKLHDGPAGSGKTCCGLEDALDAREVAAALGIPFYVWDMQTAFDAAVKRPFAEAYTQGLTPNPCVLCNGSLKFDLLWSRARGLGAEKLATGHYARVEDGRLYAATDKDKDQSYFLFPVRREVLDGLIFPLGGSTKAEVRADAERMGLVTASKPESQDVCFLPTHDHTGFVAARYPDLDGSGEIVDEAGAVLGRHSGYWRYTVGQRRGLGVAAAEPRYVLRVEPETRRVVIGPESALQHTALRAIGVHWLRRPSADEAVTARIRHRGALIPVDLTEAEGTHARMRFRAPARAATPGQAVVLYADDEVLGGGWIREVER